eukprot:2362323-Prymnesium_polylepis.1
MMAQWRCVFEGRRRERRGEGSRGGAGGRARAPPPPEREGGKDEEQPIEAEVEDGADREDGPDHRRHEEPHPEDPVVHRRPLPVLPQRVGCANGGPRA